MNKKILDEVATELRVMLSEHLHHLAKKRNMTLAKTKEELAKQLDASDSAISKLLHKGYGGLDLFTKTFAYLSELDVNSVKKLRNTLKKATPPTEADECWFSIREDLKATESELYIAARATYEAIRIKKEIESSKIKK